MNKFLIPVAGAVTLVALSAGVSACNTAPGLVHGATALRAVADSAADPAALTASSEAARRSKAAPGRAPFLLSPFGHMQAPEADERPADPAVRTRSGLYATRLQAEDLDVLLGGAVVWVEVDGREAVLTERALGHVYGLMAAKELGADAPVFVTAADQRAAATLVDQLNEQGLTQVFLVTR